MKAKARRSTPETNRNTPGTLPANVINIAQTHPQAGMSAETAEVLMKVRRIMESESPLKECLTIFIHRLDYGVGMDKILTRFVEKKPLQKPERLNDL
jgi:Flp pilus assembly protein TadB